MVHSEHQAERISRLGWRVSKTGQTRQKTKWRGVLLVYGHNYIMPEHGWSIDAVAG